MERQYKDSGIEWIGKIPETWEVDIAKHAFKQRREKGNDVECQLLAATQKNGMYPQHLLEGVVKVAADTDLNMFKTVHKNDYVISLRSFQGGFEMSDYEGVCSPAYQVFYATRRTANQYYKYLFKSDAFIQEINSLTVGIREGKNILYDDFALLPIPIPTVDDQQHIADYLDLKCGEIDSLIALQEQMIEKLKAYKQSVITEAVTKGLNPNAKLVPSGIDWIGEIPERWSLAKMDYICSVITDFVASGSFESLRINVPYIDYPDYAMLVRTADLSGTAKSDKRVYISKHSYDFLKNSNLYGGEIILPNIGASVGDVYIVPNSLYKKMSLGPNSIMFKTIYYDKYYYYYFLGEPGRRSVINMCQATAQPKFNKTQLRGLQVVLPPLEEQKRIAEFLDEKCADINRLITLKQQKIEKLKDYKKSVIYEAVTGKTIIE